MLESQTVSRAPTRIAKNKVTILVEYGYRIDELLIDAHDRQNIKIFEAKHRFQNMSLEASHNNRLSKMLPWPGEILVTLQAFEKHSDRDIERSNYLHRKLIDAFRSCNPH